MKAVLRKYFPAVYGLYVTWCFLSVPVVTFVTGVSVTDQTGLWLAMSVAILGINWAVSQALVTYIFSKED